MPARKRTIPISSPRSPSSATSSSTTPSPPRTARTPRPRASAHVLPALPGRAMQAELEALHKALEHPERPLVAVVGGAKVSTKIELLGNLVEKVDVLVIGGAMANTFLPAQGKPVGKSLYEPDLVETARKIMRQGRQGDKARDPAAGRCGGGQGIQGQRALARRRRRRGRRRRDDPGCRPASVEYVVLGAGAQPRPWCGTARSAPSRWRRSTPAPMAAAEAAAELTARRQACVGGGRRRHGGGAQCRGVADDFTYVSTAGGAFLEWLEGKDLPGVEVLKR